MRKHDVFGKAEPLPPFEVVIKEVDPINESIDNNVEIVSLHKENIELATESINNLLTDGNTLTNISSALDKEQGTIQYYTSLESYRPIITSIKRRLGVNIHVPSLEDFKNPYATETCHRLATEGIKETILKVWEKIKQFLKDLWKKISLVFKRLFKMDLDLAEYEKYVDKLIHKAKLARNSKLDVKELDSKLPQLLADKDAVNYNTNAFLNSGVRKINNLMSLLNNIHSNAPDLIKRLKEHNHELSVKLVDVKAKYEALERAVRNSDDVAVKTEAVNVIESVSDLIKQTFVFSGNISNSTEVTNSDLPDSVFEACSSINSDTVKVFKLWTMETDLPCDFGVYKLVGINNETDKPESINIVSTVEKNTTIPNKLESLSSPSNLVELYDLYKDLSKIDIRKTAKIFDDMAEESDKITNTLDQVAKLSLKTFEHDVNSHGSDDEEEKNRVKEIQETLNKNISTIGKNTTALNTECKEFTFTISTVQTEIRYELIKYIYNNCKLISE